jgi:gluconate 2-dehydrogenase
MKPKILIARAIFPETVDKLRMHFDVEDNQADELWSKPQFAAKLADKMGALTTSQPVDAETLASAPQLKICANMAVGFNNFDVAAMTARGVLGTNTPDVLTETTADFGFALVMAIARRMTESEHFLRAGKWDRWRYDMFVGSEVHGSTLGILGMGRIGQGIARRGAHGFGMNVIYNNRSRLAPELEAQCKARYVSKEELLRTADHLVLVLPYTPESHHTIGEKEIAMMKPTATLTNVARGGIVDDAALARALREKRIAGAALDVFEGEPSVHPDLLSLSNVVLTPHIASATVPTRRKMSELAADNLIGYLVHGKPLTPVNPEVLKA